jgi:PAS domain S-box-containing protein
MHRILYIDDEPGLLEIAKRFLEKTNDFSVDIDTSAEHALQSIGTLSFDAIISDYQMPGMDGIAFLKAVRSNHGNIPFILFTGRGREEVVIEAINNGVDFYLQKGGDPKAQFAELAHKIRQAISRRQAELSVIESEKRLSDIINFLPDATFAIDRSGGVIAWNRAIEEMTGVPAGDILGKEEYEYAIPFYGKRRPILIDLVFEPEEDISKNYKGIIREKDVLIAETDLPQPKGMRKVLMGKASPLYNKENEIIGAIESIRDITDKKRTDDELRAAYEQLSASQEELQAQFEALIQGEKQVRESEEKFRTFMEASIDGVMLIDVNGQILAWNPAAERIFGIPAAEATASNILELQMRLVVPEHQNPEYIEELRVRFSTSFPALFSRDTPLFLEVDVMNAKGRRMIVQQALFPIETSLGKHVGCIVREVTEQRNTEKNLRESEAKFRELAELLPQMVFEMDLEFRVTYANRYALSEIGEEDITRGISGLTYIDPCDHERVRANTGRIIRGEPVENREYTAVRKNGTTFPVLIYTSPVYRAGKIEGFRGVIIDITDRKKAENALRESERFLTETQKIARLGGWKANPHSDYLEWTEGIYDIIEAPRNYRPGLTEGLKYYSQEDIPVIREKVVTCLSTGEPFTMEARIVTETGKKVWTEVRGLAPVIEGTRSYVMGTLQDITEQKIAQDQLWDREVTLASILRVAPVGIGLVSNRVLIRVNDRLCEITGYMAEELVGKRARILYPSDEEFEWVGREKYDQILKFGTGTVETRWQRKDGAIRDILLSSTPLDPDDQVKGVTFTALDITDRKRVEKDLRVAYEQAAATEEELRGQYEELAATQVELHKRQQQLEEITGTIPEVAYQFFSRPDGSMGLYFVSDRSDAVLGISNDTRDFFERFTARVDPRDHEAFLNSVNEAVRSGSPWNFEGRFVKPSGETIWFQGMSQPFTRGTEVVFSGSLLDITGRKLAEESLQKSEEKYRTLVETTGTGFVIIDDLGRVLDANPEYVRLTGHARLGEITGRKVTEWTAPYEKDKNVGAIRQCLKEGFIRNLEIDYVNSSGTITPIEINSTLFQAGETVQVLALCRDISERRRTQVELQEGEAKYRTVVEQSHDGIFIAQDGLLIFHNPMFATMTGYRDDELVGRSIAELIAPEDRELVMTRHQERLHGKALPEVYEFSVLHHDGTSRIRVRMNITFAKVGGKPATIGTLHNVTEERKREGALRESEDRFRRLISSSFEAVVVHQDGRIALTNDVAVRIIGAESTSELVGRPILDLVHPEFRATIEDRVRQMMKSPGGAAPLIEEKFVRFDGTSVDVEVMATATMHEGKPAVMVMFRDITGRKQADEALRTSESRLRLITENMVDLITQIDKDRRVVYTSPSVERLTGYSPEDLDGHLVTEFIHPDDRERLIQKIRAAIEQQSSSVRLEFRYLEKSGKYRWFESETRILFDTNGQYCGAVFSSRDITERKQIEDQLLEKTEELDRYFTTSLDLFCIADTDGFFWRLNPEWEKTLGYTLEELEGHRFMDFVHPDDMPATLAAIADLANQNEIQSFSNRYRHRDGSYRWIEWRSVPRGNRIYAAARDMTGRRNMENAIREANRKLNLLNSVTRHDVANQLTVLQGYTEIAAMKNPDPVIADLLTRIDASSRAITRLIDFTRTYQELVIDTPAWYRIDQIVAKAGKAEIILSDTCKNVEIFADPMLERVFSNLFDNAVRHGERVTMVTLRCEHDQADLVIRVEDNGVGIPVNEKEKIFMRGYGKNTGFGLFLAREILAITGITIRETGVHGEGARFEIRVPKGIYRSTGR